MNDYMLCRAVTLMGACAESNATDPTILLVQQIQKTGKESGILLALLCGLSTAQKRGEQSGRRRRSAAAKKISEQIKSG